MSFTIAVEKPIDYSPLFDHLACGISSDETHFAHADAQSSLNLARKLRHRSGCALHACGTSFQTLIAL